MVVYKAMIVYQCVVLSMEWHGRDVLDAEDDSG
jgi:hypothetical protein